MIEAFRLLPEILKGEIGDGRAKEQGGDDPSASSPPVAGLRPGPGPDLERGRRGEDRQRDRQDKVMEVDDLGQIPDQLEQPQAAQGGEQPRPEQVAVPFRQEDARCLAEHDHQNEGGGSQPDGGRREAERDQIDGEQGDKESSGDREPGAAHQPTSRSRSLSENGTSRPIVSVLRKEGKTGGNSTAFRRRPY